MGITSFAALGITTTLNSEPVSKFDASSDSSNTPGLPAKNDFAIPNGVTYLNSAYTHPIPRAALEAAKNWAEYRADPAAASKRNRNVDVKAEFAALINAKPSEVCYVPSTSYGENLVVNGLDIPHTEGNVVTDELHFEGAILHLQALQKRYGLDLRIVKSRDWRIHLSDLERAMDKRTKLVEISLVAMNNGFQHDLKAVCDLAHAHGAYVYTDIAQAAGCTPIDVRESGVDFCACSSFKWLMGDFGLGFLFVKGELLDKVIWRTQWGYYQARELDSHFMPGDSPNASPYTWELESDATGHFEVGTQAIGVSQVLAQSLPYIRRLGLEQIEGYRQPLLKRLRAEMPRLGFELLTPPESKSALISFAIRDHNVMNDRLKSAGVNVRIAEHYVRLSPSVFNDMNDIERFLEAVS
jgi:selenocysteine lyase/cysteine desulfurase